MNEDLIKLKEKIHPNIRTIFWNGSILHDKEGTVKTSNSSVIESLLNIKYNLLGILANIRIYKRKRDEQN